jgi:hypothetical protein
MNLLASTPPLTEADPRVRLWTGRALTGLSTTPSDTSTR